MVKLARIFRDYDDAGSLNELIALWGFVDEVTFLTKAGHLGVVYELQGVEPDGLTPNVRRQLTHHIEAALRLLDERYRVYQYIVKERVRPFVSAACTHPVVQTAIQQRAAFLNQRRDNLFAIRLFFVLLYEPDHVVRRTTNLGRWWVHPRRALSDWLSPRTTLTVLESELDQAIAELHHHADGLQVQLSELRPRHLQKDEAFEFFRLLLNYDRSTLDASPAARDAHIDFLVSDSAVECHRDHLSVGHQHVKVLSMKEPPSQTFAMMLQSLCDLPGELVACLEWQRLPNDRVRRDLNSRRRHFFNKRVSLMNYAAADPRPEEMMIDESATLTVRALGDALTEVEVNGHFFGACSLTLALHGDSARDIAHQTAEAKKLFATYDGCLLEETYNLLNAWLSIVPGNGAYNLRRLALLETNVADLSLLARPHPGETTSAHLTREALAVFETPHHVPYAYNLHVQDVGHTLMLGATGSGKSFLLNFLVTQAQKYEPTTVILDLGHSYRKLCTLLKGRYVEIGLLQRDVTINPFALEPTPEHLHFLHAFMKVLLEGEDGYRLSDLEDRELYESVENLYVLEAAQRRLFTMANLLPRALGARLHKWVEGGRYSDLFDNVEDTLTFENLQVFDFEAMRAYPSLLEPLLFYVLHRVTERIGSPSDAGRLKLCVMDEAWRFIQHPTLRAYVQEGLKTWRKRNASMVLATQTIDDFASTDLLRTVVESCPTKLLLANPAFDRTRYAELFQLNERELDLVADLTPRQQFLLKRPDLTKVLSLTVDPKTYWIYTNTPIDNERVAAVFRELGFEAGLDHLAASA